MKKRSLVSGVVAVAMAASVFTTAGAAGVSYAETNTVSGGAVSGTAATATPAPATGTAVTSTATTGTAATGTATTGTSVKVKKVTGVKAVRKTSKKAVVSWKKVTGAAGYQVKYSLKKNLKSAKTKNVAKKTKLTITGLKKNKVYYVKVRAYKKANGKKVYGAYSKVVKIKKK